MTFEKKLINGYERLSLPSMSIMSDLKQNLPLCLLGVSFVLLQKMFIVDPESLVSKC